MAGISDWGSGWDPGLGDWGCGWDPKLEEWLGFQIGGVAGSLGSHLLKSCIIIWTGNSSYPFLIHISVLIPVLICIRVHILYLFSFPFMLSSFPFLFYFLFQFFVDKTRNQVNDDMMVYSDIIRTGLQKQEWRYAHVYL